MKKSISPCVALIIATAACSGIDSTSSNDDIGPGAGSASDPSRAQQPLAHSTIDSAVSRHGASRSSGDSSQGHNSHKIREFRAGTFNAALAPNFAPLVSERTPQVIQALATQAKRLDLLCVQEFWNDSDFVTLANAGSNELPLALRRAPRPGTGTCSIDELTTLGQCLQMNCSTATGTDQVLCAESSCASQVGSLSGGCLGCIMNNIGSDFSMCAGPGGEGDPAIYGGAFDVGMLSRLPIIESDVTKELDSYFVRMAVLYAKIDVPGGQPIHAFCTHLGSPLDIIPYAGKFASWQDEHLHQVQQLREYIDQKAGPRGRVILMGDMNSGPDGNGMVGEWADNYAALVANDLVDPYFAQRNVDCTWCPDNTWVDDASPKRLIDHILLRNFGRSDSHVARILENPVNVVAQETSIATNLSDHYGLWAETELE